MSADDGVYELREHTADVAVEATASTLEGVFAAVAAGLTAAHADVVPAGGAPASVSVRAESREALLFDYLGELIYRRDADSVLPADHDVSIREDGEWVADAVFRGVSLGAVQAREIKAVTYSEMELSETPSGWRAYVVFDV